IVIQWNALQHHRAFKVFQALALATFHADQRQAVTVTDFQRENVWRLQGGIGQVLQNYRVAADDAVFHSGRQLVGDQLAGLAQLLLQILKALEGEQCGQQKRQQQCRHHADQLGTGMNVQSATPSHRVSPAASWRVNASSSSMARPRALATWRLLTTLKWLG